MTQTTYGLGLETLLSVAAEVAPKLPEDLIRKAYAIQRNHQFDRDRTISFQEMRRLIEELVQEPTREIGE